MNEKRKQKPRRWYIKFPLDAYALGPVDGIHNEREAREFARKFEGVKRLPRGFQCWPE
jgi:hypothetical protein